MIYPITFREPSPCPDGCETRTAHHVAGWYECPTCGRLTCPIPLAGGFDSDGCLHPDYAAWIMARVWQPRPR